jgi:hypothetical protein
VDNREEYRVHDLTLRAGCRFFPPQLLPLGRRNESEATCARARNRFKDVYSLQRTFPLGG